MIARVESKTSSKDDTTKQDDIPERIAARANLDRNTSYGAYGAGNNRVGPDVTPDDVKSDLSSAAWEKSKDTPWAASPQGRLAIRTVSRGLFGAAAFAVGGMYAEKCMKAYSSANGFLKQENSLQYLAKGIDTVVGKPIQAVVKAVTGSEEAALRAVSFRPTKFADPVTHTLGRSLGAETVGVTFDFFCASVGDAFGRDLINLIDPNTKKPWNDKEGHFSVGASVKNAAKNVFRYVTYNGGEDWAVAIPYVYFMKGQRALINHYSPGFQYDFDRGLNGGSFKVDRNNKVVGSYGLEGLLDLQSRFTVYNVGTLMYREAYNHIAAKMEGKPTALYGAPDDPANANKGILEKAADLGKWAARSAIKGVVYMTPAVPFFWVTRSAQSKSSSVFVNQDGDLLSTMAGKRPNTVRSHEFGKPGTKQDVYYTNYSNEHGWQKTSGTFQNPFDNTFEHYKQSGNFVDQSFNKIGEINQKISDKIASTASTVDDYLLEHPHLDYSKQLGITSTRKVLSRFANAAVSYTPYMYAKAEFANLWDDGKMDMSAERLINGATSFNWGEFKAGAGEVWQTLWKKPLSDPEREKEAQRRIDLDRSAPADFRKVHGERASRINEKKAQELRDANLKASAEPTGLSWQDRIVALKGGTVEKSPQFDSRPRSHAESEAMKKALAELTPPTNAIN